MDSVRTRPMPPLAPLPTAARISSGALELAEPRIVNGVPSRVRLGRAASGSGRARRPHQLDLAAAGFGGLFGGGVHRQHGAFAVQHGAVAVGGGRHAFAHAAESAGTPMPRAMMAAWLVTLSFSETRPRIMLRSSANRSLG